MGRSYHWCLQQSQQGPGLFQDHTWEAEKCNIQSIRTTCARVCQPCLGSLHSQQHQDTNKGSEAGSKMGETGLQKISVCGHHARTTALANTRAAEKASTPHYLLQVPRRSHPHRVKTPPLTNRPLQENHPAYSRPHLWPSIPLDSIQTEDFFLGPSQRETAFCKKWPQHRALAPLWPGSAPS